MFDGFGIWDLDGLNAAYDIDWTTGLDAKFILSVPEECVLTPKEGRGLLNGGPNLWAAWDAKCPDVLDLAGNTGLLFCDQQHQFCGDHEAQLEAYAIYSNVRLAPGLRRHVASSKPGFEEGGYGDLAVHSRRAGEGGFDWELCVNGNRKTCNGHVAGPDRGRFCDMLTMKGNCTAWLDLDYQIKDQRALQRSHNRYRFMLASDGTHDWSLDYPWQFIVANNTAWLHALERRAQDAAGAGDAALVDGMAVSALARSKLRGRADLAPLLATLDSVTATLLDLFSLVDARYLLGMSRRRRAPPTRALTPRRRSPSPFLQAYYSTLSLNACYLRGVERMYVTWPRSPPRHCCRAIAPAPTPVAPSPSFPSQIRTCARRPVD